MLTRISDHMRFGAVVLATTLVTIPVSAGADDVANLFTEGSANLDFRYRIEYVESDFFTQDATASILRTRLTFTSGEVSGISALVQMDDLRSIGDDSYNSTRNGKTSRPVVADPEATELNQAYVKYTGVADTSFELGRQRIIHDSHRFIGNVVWRQNEQTYDAFTIKNKSISNLALSYSYIENVNRVFGPNSGTPAADFRSDSHALRAQLDASNFGNIIGYAYVLDFDNAPALSSSTYGLRFKGSWEMNEKTSLLYTAEYAYQEDNADNPNNYSATYWLLEGGLKIKKVTGKISYEVLEGNATMPGDSFQTPLATLHAFQGWADQFLATPGAGIEDLHFTIDANIAGFRAMAVWHRFEPEAGGPDYGDELDLLLSRKFGDHYSVMLKYAGYNADNLLVDTEKFWFMFSAGF